ncbi:predicted protein [Histoplasma capsulatum G186AR]|uniref:Uncharacterized protein n=1 Tax=Ajellomyces capsulatus (strain G186AR / H82 / ATCC MYA-2454 / RMSCC 2432) TaxID=447093 RepID=C0NIN7_AJECG|nr:uncharacterized protein HCBG_02294 [Histoplasma capsulatum G186AR]EEH08757.1 predicted protein [Histoplasma capsulatum G186AR]
MATYEVLLTQLLIVILYSQVDDVISYLRSCIYTSLPPALSQEIARHWKLVCRPPGWYSKTTAKPEGSSISGLGAEYNNGSIPVCPALLISRLNIKWAVRREQQLSTINSQEEKNPSVNAALGK